MKYSLGILLILVSSFFSVSLSASEKMLINSGWSFSLSDDKAAFQPEFDDHSWRILDLPHDWAFENGYSEDGAQQDRGGYASGGIGWYRKSLDFTAEDLNASRHFLYFEGVYMNSEVWINGHYLGKRPYGYVSFEYEITQYLHAGTNIVAVKVNNTLEPSARWYHGCGIYGSVYLKKSSAYRFATDGIFISSEYRSPSEAILRISAESDIQPTAEEKGLSVSYQIFSPDGTEVLSGSRIRLADLEEGITVGLANPQRWDIDSPFIYSAVLKLCKGKKVMDTETVRFGIRTIEWKPATGFWLNGRNLKLQGVCEHLEGGPVGAAWTKDLMRWKLGLIKKMGANSIRTAHNPQLPMFYELCDELGILVMDEVFDGWMTKASYDYGNQAFDQWWERDLRATLRRDRNHPSIIIYSVGNETKGDVAADLVKVCHEEDSTRLVTSGHSGSEFMDVLGVNGHSEKKTFIETFKPGEQAFVGTETPHTWQVRGYYRTKTWYRDGYPNKKQAPFEIPDLTDHEIFTYEWAAPSVWTSVKQHYNSSYDNATVRINARQNIEFLRDLPWYSGSYRWTGFDYLGEAGYVHGGWPFRAFMGGTLDLAGFEKDHYYLYQAEWNDEPMVHLLPHWTHPYMVPGTLIPVVAYTNAEEVELFVDGKSYGKQTKGEKWNEMAGEWQVPWQEGTIEAIAYNAGQEVARAVHRSSSEPSVLSVGVDILPNASESYRTSIITVAEHDESSVLYPYGENRIYFDFSKGVSVLSLENGNPTDIETNWNAKSKNAFFGLLRAFVRIPSEAEEGNFHVGSIMGDKKLKISDRITIDVKNISLVDGCEIAQNYDIYYTLDGTDPDRSSSKYTVPLRIALETVVKAVVYLQDRELFRMEERFGENEGIYWGDGSSVNLTGIQAEMTDYEGLEKSVDLKEGYQGACYLETSSNNASLSFYQENDGSDRSVDLSFSFFHEQGQVSVSVYNNGAIVASERIVDIPDKRWTTRSLKIPLQKGANQIVLRIEGTPGNGIDWIKLAE